jgi:hypothetical protein
MHGDDELGRIESASLLGVGQIPYPPQGLIRQPGTFEYLLRGLT